MGLLLSLSTLLFLETFKLYIISATSSLMKVYTLHVKCRYLFRVLTSSSEDSQKKIMC